MKTKVRIKTNPKIKIIEEENSLLFPVYSYIKKDEYHEGYEIPMEYNTLEVLMDSSINEYGGDGKTNYRILIEEYIKYYEGGNKNDANSIISSHKKRLISVDMKPYSAVYFILK